MFNWLNKWRKEKDPSSLGEVEQAIHSASYSPAEPTAEFSQGLKYKLLAARRNNLSSSMENSTETSSFFQFRWKVWVPAASLAVIILLLLPTITPWFGGDKFLLIDRVSAQTAFEVTPVLADATGVEAKTPFRLKTKVATDESELKKNMHFESVACASCDTRLSSEMAFELNKISETEFEVVPAAPLAAGTVYNLIIDSAYQNEQGVTIPKEFRFAFQVKDTFKVLGTIPGDKKDYIPTNSAVEVTFSHSMVKVEDFEKHFSMTPEVKGRFEKHDRALVFIPKNPLANETLYSVTISKDLPLADSDQVLAEDSSFQFFTEPKQEDRYGHTYLNFSYASQFQSFQPTERPRLPMYVQFSDAQPEEYGVKVYRVASLDELKKKMETAFAIPGWVCFSCVNHDADTKGLPVALETSLQDSLKAKPDGMTQSNENMNLELPPIAELGFYILEISRGDQKVDQVIFQVSNLKAFAMATDTKTLLWVQNVKDPKPQQDAEVSFVRNSATGKTNEQGVATINTPFCDEGQTYPTPQMISVRSAGDELVLILPEACRVLPTLQPEYYYSASPDYWTTFSTDRSLYLPTDTVFFWGVAKRRKGHKPETLTAELTSYKFEDPIAVAKIESSDIGTFKGKLDIKRLPADYYTLTLKDSSGVKISSHGVSIATFQKPLYDMDIQLDKKAVSVGEKITATVSVKFFDGTPAKNIELRTSDPDGTNERVVTTDAQGQVNVIYTANVYTLTQDFYFDNPVFGSVFFEPVAAEYGLARGEAVFHTFRADREVRLERDEKANTVKGLVRAMDIAKFGNEQAGESYFGAGVANQAVQLEVTKEWYESIEEGEEYSPIDKTVHKRYRSELRRDVVKSSAVTTNEKGEFSVDYAFAKDTSYRIKASTKDSKGRDSFDVMNYYAVVRRDSMEGGYENFEESPWISLVDVKNTSYDRARDDYDVGEPVQLELRMNEKPIPAKGQFLFFEAQGGLISVHPSSEAKFGFTFEKEHIPSVSVGAVWFDGKFFKDTFEQGNGAEIYYDFEAAKKLTVEVTPDKTSYRPGEKAVLNVSAKNKDGRGVSAEVNMKLVDEAIYALSESYEDPLNELYRSLGSGIRSVATTARDPSSEGAGGKGGGGGEPTVRRVFKTTPYFDVVQTDGSGHAKVTVSLPDDLTTFRITAQAVTDDLQAGISRTPLVVSIPFFVDLTVNDQYLVSDQPQIRLRAFGTELPETADVEYTISAPSLGEKEKKITAKSGEAVWYPLPALALGQHDITVKAKSGDKQDAIAKTIRVVSSLLTVPVSETKMLQDGTLFSGTSIPRAKLVFSLAPYGEYYEELENLRWSYHGRIDARFAAQTARELLDTYFGEKAETNIEENYAAYQGREGGLQLLPYGDQDLEVSFRAAFFAKDRVNTETLTQYFDGVLENQKGNRNELAMALAGKAALKLPVLNDIHLFLAHQEKDLMPKDKLVLALGLAELGDNAKAAEILDAVRVLGEKHEGEAYLLDVSESDEEDQELTALAAEIAALSSHSDAAHFWKAALKFKPTNTITNVERVVALQAFLKHLPPVQDGSAQYELPDSRSESVSLKKSETKSIFVTGEELAQMKFSHLKGPMAVTVYMEAPLTEVTPQFTKTLNVSRSYTVNGKATNTFKEGDLVRVVLHPEVSAKRDTFGYEVIDTLPTGLLPLTSVSYEYAYYGGSEYYGRKNSESSYPYAVEGQRLSFRASWNNSDISYLARVVSKGTFTAEPVLVKSVSDDTRMNISEPGRIEIK